MPKYIGTTYVVPISEAAMKRTLYIPDKLWGQLEEYLKNHPEQNPSSLIQVALEEK